MSCDKEQDTWLNIPEYVREFFQYFEPLHAETAEWVNNLQGNTLEGSNFQGTFSNNSVSINAQERSPSKIFIEKLLCWMPYAVIMSIDAQRPPADYSGGCIEEQIVKMDFFRSCLTKQSETLILNGLPGVGKTVVMQSICFRLLEQSPPVKIASAFFDHRKTDVNTAAQVLIIFIKQLLEQKAVTNGFEQKLFKKFDDISRDITKIFAVLVEIIQRATEVCIIMDGLDEFPDETERDILLVAIRNIQDRTEVGVILTERPGKSIGSSYFPPEKTKICTIDAEDRDIRSYIEKRFSDWWKHRLGQDCAHEEKNGFVDKAAEVITNAATAKDISTRRIQRIFLLVKLFTDFVHIKKSVADRDRALREVDRITKSCRKANGEKGYVDAVLEKAIDGHLSPSWGEAVRSDEQEIDYARCTFRYVRDAARPLSEPELQRLLAIQNDHMLKPSTQLLEWDQLQKICYGLVELDQCNTVRFIHRLIPDKLRSAKLLRKFPDAHTELAKACVDYLSIDLNPKGACRTEEQLEARRKELPFFNYAARHWHHHFERHLQKFDTTHSSLQNNPEAKRLSEAALSFLQNNDSVDAAWQIMQTNDNVQTDLDRENAQNGSASKLLISIIWQDGPNPVKIADPYACRQLTGMHLACFYGFESLACELLRRHADRNKRPAGGKGSRPAGRSSSLINKTDFRGRTALNLAAYAGHNELVQKLLEKGADPNKGDHYNVNPLHCAAFMGFLPIVQLLLDLGEDRLLDVNAQTKNPPEVSRFRRLQFRPANESSIELAQSVWGRTALHFASKRGHAEIVKVLLEDPRTKSEIFDSAGMTSLHKAAKYGHLEVINHLTTWEDPFKQLSPHLPAQIPPNGDSRQWAAELQGCTSLHLACMEGHDAVVKQFLRKCPDLVEARNDQGNTALDFSRYYKRKSTEILLTRFIEGQGVSSSSTGSSRSSLSHEVDLNTADAMSSRPGLQINIEGEWTLLNRDKENHLIDTLSLPSSTRSHPTRPTTPIPQVFWNDDKGFGVIRSHGGYLDGGDDALLNSVVFEIPKGSRTSTDSLESPIA